MEAEREIVNRVANSSLITFDLEELYQPGERILFDITPQLYEGLILREKDFRAFVKGHDWKQYEDKYVAITCSADAIIPKWAYMLLTSALQPYAREIVFGTLEDLEAKIFSGRLAKVDWDKFAGAKVVLKGCSKVDVPEAVYVEATRFLTARVSSLMFGEPCSTVPVFKRPKA